MRQRLGNLHPELFIRKQSQHIVQRCVWLFQEGDKHIAMHAAVRATRSPCGSIKAKPFPRSNKLAVVTSASGELLRSPNAETLMRQALIESTGPAIDRVLFSTNAAGTDRPAGLLNGIAALPATAAGPSKGEVLVDDLQKLATAIGPVSGNGNIVLIASPDAAAALVMRLPSSVQWPVLTSASLPARTVIAVAANAIVSAVEGSPQIDASQEAEFHRDSVPQEIVSAAGTVAQPVGSVWALRDSRGVAFMQNVNW
jgi:hypothetical protein